MKTIKPDDIIDLKGVPCPRNSAKAVLKLAGMDSGEILEIIVDDGEPIENVPPSLEEDGSCDILQTVQGEDKMWHIFVKVK